ncbi:hypothetical protein [Fimbriiglobus ruber]|nr:hypothetical protein [Fimbriiglobus ruber]
MPAFRKWCTVASVFHVVVELAMHPIIPHNPNPMHVATHAERLAKEQVGKTLGIVFSVITAVSLGVLTTKTVLDMVRGRNDRDGHHERGR